MYLHVTAADIFERSGRVVVLYCWTFEGVGGFDLFDFAFWGFVTVEEGILFDIVSAVSVKVLAAEILAVGLLLLLLET